MHRIDTDGSISGAFSDGNPATGTLGTKVDASWLNESQEEICQLLEAMGVTPTKGQMAQLLSACVSAATAKMIVRRDANGRAQVADPAAPADIATKNYVDNGGPRVRAWAVLHIDAAGAVAVNSGSGIASASWTAGDITVVLSTAAPSANYAILLTAGNGYPTGGVSWSVSGTPGTGSFKFNCSTGGSGVVNPMTNGFFVHVAVFY